MGSGAAHVRRTQVVVLSSHVVGMVTPSVFTFPTSVPQVCTASFIPYARRQQQPDACRCSAHRNVQRDLHQRYG